MNTLPLEFPTKCWRWVELNGRIVGIFVLVTLVPELRLMKIFYFKELTLTFGEFGDSFYTISNGFLSLSLAVIA